MANNKKKKNKKEIKDSIDIQDIQAQQQQEENNKKESTSDQKESKPFNFIEFMDEHKVPIISYVYKLFKYDLNNFKNSPNDKSEDTFFLKNVSNKSRFFIKIAYLIIMILLAALFITFGVLFILNVFDIESFSQNSGNNYLAAMFMAVGVVILGFFI